MPGLTTPTTLRQLYTSLRKNFDVGLGQGSSDLSVLATSIPSTVKIETYAWLGAFPKFREWIGQRMVQGLKERVFQITNKDYESTIGVDRNALDDGQLASAQMIVQNMGLEAKRLVNDLLITALTNGHAAACYDGQNFFDTDHPTDPDLGAGTQSNYEASGFALTRANFITARGRMRAFKGENGRPFGAGNNLVLVVPLALEQTAIDIVGVDNVAVAGGVQTNTLKGAAKIVVVPELDAVSTTAWYLFDVGPGDPKPLILQTRQAPRFQSKTNPDEENVFWHKEYIFGGDCRYGVGYGAWFKAFKGVG